MADEILPSPWIVQVLRNLSFIILSFLFFPLNTYILASSYVLQVLIPQLSSWPSLRRSPNARARTVLITGVGTSNGLSLARSFYRAGHTVIGGDFLIQGLSPPSRYSRAIKWFYALPKVNEDDDSPAFIQSLLKIVRRESVDLWISCSGSPIENSKAKEVIEKRSSCLCINFDTDTNATLHDEKSFLDHARSLGLPVPETHALTSRAAVHKILGGAAPAKRSYVLKDGKTRALPRQEMIVLPRRTLSQTYQHVSQVQVSASNPIVLQQFVQGEQYQSEAVIIGGEVVAFVAVRLQKSQSCVEALPAESSLNQAMLRFTQQFTARNGGDISGHLSFTFLVEEKATEKGFEKALYTIGCSAASQFTGLLLGRNGHLPGRYLERCVLSAINGYSKPQPEVIMSDGRKYYWTGHDLVTLVLYPALLLLVMRVNIYQFLSGVWTFARHLALDKEAIFEIWDPIPWWWMYQVYLPLRLLRCLFDKTRWERLKPSTLEMSV